MKSRRIRYISSSGLIAAVYAVLTLVALPISFGVYQVRIAEALTVLPFLTAAAIPGLYVGCVLANIIGGMGWLDIVIGPLITLVAAFATRFIRNHLGDTTRAMVLAPLPPVIFNAFGVSLYLAPLLGFNYWFSVQMVGIGQLVACYVIGLPLLILLRKRGIFV
ncbi:MAG: QueT transporter family protein [Candidatus Zixiibacteriota bacterium]|nr:MAG: QueT transporter family protein [candidate division Zixibacteria bacterium]